MFKRKKPLTLLQKLKEIYWPSMGWLRLGKYIKHRTTRIADTNHKIAMGLALGAAISFSPLVFTHIIQGCLLAIILRGNYIAVAIGTILGNPWTFPFLWWAGMGTGKAIFAFLGFPASTSLPDEISMSVLFDLIQNDPYRIFAPWMLGGYLLVLITLPCFYLFFYNLVKGAKLARKKAKQRKAQQTARQITKPQKDATK